MKFGTFGPSKLVASATSTPHDSDHAECLHGLLRGDLIETCKLLTVWENIDCNCLLHLDDSHYNTRGHKYKFKKQRSHLDIWKNFFSN